MELVSRSWFRDGRKQYRQVRVRSVYLWDLEGKTPEEFLEWAKEETSNLSDLTYKDEPIVNITLADESGYDSFEYAWVGRVYESNKQRNNRMEKELLARDAEEKALLEKELKEYERLKKKFKEA